MITFKLLIPIDFGIAAHNQQCEGLSGFWCCSRICLHDKLCVWGLFHKQSPTLAPKLPTARSLLLNHNFKHMVDFIFPDQFSYHVTNMNINPIYQRVQGGDDSIPEIHSICSNEEEVTRGQQCKMRLILFTTCRGILTAPLEL